MSDRLDYPRDWIATLLYRLARRIESPYREPDELCPDCRIGPLLPDGVECPFCRAHVEAKQRDDEIYCAGREDAMRERGA